MNRPPTFFAVLFFLLAGLGISKVTAADDKVTIPRSRLEELERKEAELNRLKGEDALRTNLAPQVSPGPVTVGTNASVTPAPAAPRMRPEEVQALPPLKSGEVVQATEVAAHYAADPVMADRRYRKHTFTVEGEIAGFEKTMFIRNYKILLNGQASKVVCDFYPPDKYKSIYTINHGTELVAVLENETRVPLARVGQKVTIEGRCAGGDHSEVKLTRCSIKSGGQ